MDGSMWDELMGFVNGPVPDEPIVKSESVKAGRIHDDGTYEQYGSRSSRSKDDTIPLQSILSRLDEQIERESLFRNARVSLEAMGFELPDNATKTPWEELGGILP